MQSYARIVPACYKQLAQRFCCRNEWWNCASARRFMIVAFGVVCVATRVVARVTARVVVRVAARVVSPTMQRLVVDVAVVAHLCATISRQHPHATARPVHFSYPSRPPSKTRRHMVITHHLGAVSQVLRSTERNGDAMRRYTWRRRMASRRPPNHNTRACRENAHL